MLATVLFKKRHPKVGARPGTLVIDEHAPPPKIHVMHFTPDKLREEDVTDLDKLQEAHGSDTVTWVDVQGFGDEAVIRRVGEIFSLHPLAVEDVVNLPQRPKVAPYDQQLLIVVRMAQLTGPEGMDIEQVSIVLGKNYVLTFQERYGDVLDPVRQRIRAGNARIRTEGADYVAYAIFDTIVDNYYPVLESVGDHVERLEDDVINRPTPELLHELTRTKNRLTQLRRCIWPQREVANSLVRDESPFVDDNVRIFLRDTYDHCIQTSEIIELYREMVTGLMNTYLSSIANRTNEVMKVLTIVATVFIPLTFVAGVYGMNFEHMPELHQQWAYPIVWVTMLSIGIGMLAFFWRKGWIGPKR